MFRQVTLHAWMWDAVLELWFTYVPYSGLFPLLFLFFPFFCSTLQSATTSNFCMFPLLLLSSNYHGFVCCLVSKLLIAWIWSVGLFRFHLFSFISSFGYTLKFAWWVELEFLLFAHFFFRFSGQSREAYFNFFAIFVLALVSVYLSLLSFVRSDHPLHGVDRRGSKTQTFYLPTFFFAVRFLLSAFFFAVASSRTAGSLSRKLFLFGFFSWSLQT